MKIQRRFTLLAFSIIFVITTSCKKTDLTPNIPSDYTNYSVFAWNDLGMHCLNPSYDKLVILPPYNTIRVQVVKRGSSPEVVTTGITVSYKILNNTFSYGKRQYGGFWDNAQKLFGVTLAHDIGLKGKGLTGNMNVEQNHFIAEGIPVVPVDDGNAFNPFQVVEISVTDGSGNEIAKTRTTIPTSDEINCAKCHGTSDPFTDILRLHDQKFGTSIQSNKPVLCASCHPSPALGINTGPQMYMSRAIHGSHSSRDGITCYDCHPGLTTKCNRSLAHTANDGNCTKCHGTMSNVASSIASGRVPWGSEPACATCHTGVDGVNTSSTLYRNATGHGGMGCPSCHGSPHAMMPSREASDNYQSVQYQGFTSKIKTIGSCGVCHNSSRGESGEIGDFSEQHGGTNPSTYIGCNACHTSIPSTTSAWPHAYTWKNSN